MWKVIGALEKKEKVPLAEGMDCRRGSSTKVWSTRAGAAWAVFWGNRENNLSSTAWAWWRDVIKSWEVLDEGDLAAGEISTTITNNPPASYSESRKQFDPCFEPWQPAKGVWCTYLSPLVCYQVPLRGSALVWAGLAQRGLSSAPCPHRGQTQKWGFPQSESCSGSPSWAGRTWHWLLLSGAAGQSAKPEIRER